MHPCSNLARLSEGHPFHNYDTKCNGEDELSHQDDAIDQLNKFWQILLG